MKFIVERNALFAALTRTAGVVGRRSQIEILKHVRIETFATHISLVTTNLDIQATINVPARIETAGSTTVAAKRLREICARLPEGAEIVIDASDPLRAQIKAGRSKFSIGALPVDAFPLLNEPEGGAVLEMAAGAMLRLLTIGSDCMGEPTRNLNCCYLHRVDDAVRAVSTDSKTLTYCDATAGDFAPKGGVRIGADTVAVLLRALAGMGATDMATLTVIPDKMLGASLGGLDIVARVVDGEYPPYLRAIPAASENRFTVDVGDFTAMVQRAMIAAQHIDIDLSQDRMEVRARDQTSGDASEEEAETDWTGGERRICVNGAFLLGILAHVTTECATIQSDDKISPLRIMQTGDTDWLGLCMTMGGSR